MHSLKKYHRRSIRLKGYDYSQEGSYFLTIRASQGKNLFGDIINGEMVLNEYGIIVRDEWLKTEIIRTEIVLDEYVIMPNHFHAIVSICRDDRIGVGNRPVADTNTLVADTITAATYTNCSLIKSLPGGPKPKSIGALVSGFKSVVTKRVNEIRQTPGCPVWLRNYYEHIIRNEEDLNRIRQYIINNPAKWGLSNE